MLDRIKFASSLLVLILVIIACGNKSTTQNSGTNSGTQPNTQTQQTPPVETKKGQTPQTIQGKGTKTQFVELNSGLAIFDITFKGSGHVGIWLKNSDGQNVALLTNAIGNWSGSTSESIPAAGQYIIDVDGEGTWSISIK